MRYFIHNSICAANLARVPFWLVSTLFFMTTINHVLAEETRVIATEETAEIEEVIEIVGISPTHGTGVAKKKIPHTVQTANDTDLQKSQSFGLPDFLGQAITNLSVTNASGNPLQPDILYRGYQLSPLLGVPQGISVYQDGVRLNDPFGDTVSWELVPEFAIAGINLFGGANPVFGLNTLGGALSMTTKNGFTHPKYKLRQANGAYGYSETTLEAGHNNGERFGIYLGGNHLKDDGWRRESPSKATNFFSAFSFREINTSLDLTISHGDTKLIGNGPAPVELLSQARDAVFTTPDITENEQWLVNLQGQHWLSEAIEASGNIFYLRNTVRTLNGDGSNLEACDPPNDDFLCEEDDPDEPVLDQNGNRIAEENNNGSERDAIANRSTRKLKNFGGSFQLTFFENLLEYKNQFTVGMAFQKGVSHYFSTVEIGSLNCTFFSADCELPYANRGVLGNSLYDRAAGVEISATSRSASIYFSDTLSLTKKLSLTTAARLDHTRVSVSDETGRNPLVVPENPENLNGNGTYLRVNPSIGATYQYSRALNFFANYSESSRAPTPIELMCADVNLSCRLPNVFLSDPPLDQVVTRAIEWGARGDFSLRALSMPIAWSVTTFISRNENDIVFNSTGGASSNEGYFRNVGATQRIGVEFDLSGKAQVFDWRLAYGFVNATFQTPFRAASANHPNAAADGSVSVERGDRIPGIPQHTLKFAVDYRLFKKRLTLSPEILYTSGQYLRGDEANLLAPISGYALVNLRASYTVNKNVRLFARINNLLNKKYETFGLLGEPGEVFDSYTNERFLSPGAPISGGAGIEISF